MTASNTESLFFTVPSVALPAAAGGAVVPAFRVARYLAAKDVAGNLIISPTAPPWVAVTFSGAREAAANAGLALITETQLLAIACDLVQQGANWTGGAAGAGRMNQGYRFWPVDRPQSDASPLDNRQWFVMASGERIYDAAGNLNTWSVDDVQGDANGIVSAPFANGSASISASPYASLQHGMGRFPAAGVDWSGQALIRGGNWMQADGAGVFHLNAVSKYVRSDVIGFRCTSPGATEITLAGPAHGTDGIASMPFEVGVTPVGRPIDSPLTVTMSDGGAGGTFNPPTVSLTNAAPHASVTYTPAADGAVTITATNNAGFTNPVPITYSVSEPVA